MTLTMNKIGAFRKAAFLTEHFLSLKNRPVPKASLSTGPQQQHETFYEFRTYSIHPHLNTAFLKLTNEKIHLRTAHSELIGFWTVEYGGLNQIFHIWKYDSYAQRASVRASLAQDPCWIEQFSSKVLPMLSSQDNEITYLVPWSKIQKPPKEGGVYELATFQMKPGGPAVWGAAFQAAVGTHTGSGYTHSVGVFHSEIRLLNQVHVLWWYESADERAAIRRKSHGDVRVVAAVRESAAYLVSQKNKLMYPCPFSPIK
ncbi:protein NipSnap homolog 3A-like [Xyrauchen texanus]|uniref:protein NipSnap homolog 3A-like n=1 Tax=Xyrauchen texanus TaxID=154827 RepID=UPI002241B6E2|nr:protein NipSnap homolog 3A-like [Xyrauchen texanus]